MKSFEEWMMQDPVSAVSSIEVDDEEIEEVRCACGSEYGEPNADDGKFYCNRGHGGAYHCAP